MTANEWVTSRDLHQMLGAVAKRATPRKLRLFACACCRRVWEHLADERSRAGVEAAERFADGEITRSELSAAHSSANRATRQWYAPPHGTATEPNRDRGVASVAVRYATQSTERPARLVTVARWSAEYVRLAGGSNPLDPTGQAVQCDLLRDIFGQPFAPLLFSSACRTNTAVALAKQMYEAREFGAMPILADALQDAGCDNADVLGHCRDANQVHVRGCWVVDRVLGKV